MSVTTTADLTVDQMRKDIDTAFKSTHRAFTEILVDRVWGADEFTDEFKQKLENAHRTLMELRRDMGEPRFLD
jgi:hypothetical protein